MLDAKIFTQEVSRCVHATGAQGCTMQIRGGALAVVDFDKRGHRSSAPPFVTPRLRRLSSTRRRQSDTVAESSCRWAQAHGRSAALSDTWDHESAPGQRHFGGA